jgi:hypothetical protein
MLRKVSFLVVALGLAVTSAATIALAQQPSAEQQIQNALLTYFAGMQEESIEKCLSVYHGDGPGRMPAEQSMRNLFPVTDFTYEVRDVKILGGDERYAAVRFKNFTKLVGEPKIVVNKKESLTEMLAVFRPGADGSWKLWTMTMLESEPK